MKKCSLKFLTRKKKFNEDTVNVSALQRVMGILDVSAIGNNQTIRF